MPKEDEPVVEDVDDDEDSDDSDDDGPPDRKLYPFMFSYLTLDDPQQRCWKKTNEFRALGQ